MANQMQAQELLELGVMLGREVRSGKMDSLSAYGIAKTAKQLIRLARRLHTLDERACNEEMPENYDQRLEAKIGALCHDLG